MDTVHPDSRLYGLLKKILGLISETPILRMNFSAGSNPGDNIVAKMISVEMETSTGQKDTIIIKGLLPFGQIDPFFSTQEKQSAQVMTALRLFGTELGYYQRIKPEIEKHFSSYQIHSLPAPRYFYGLDDIENGGLNSCLVLEDLRPKGYRMANKMDGLTEDEVSLVLREIARFHAVSYVYLKQHQKDLLENIKRDPATLLDPLVPHHFAKSKGLTEQEHTSFLGGLYFYQIEHAKEIGKLSSDLHEKIMKFHSNPMKKIIDDAEEARNEYFCVVIHGDLWVNNILFKYKDEDGKVPEDVQFVDFQQCRYASVFDELHYFIYTSTTAEMRQKKLPEWLDYYYTVFMDAFQIMKMPAPTGFTKEEFLKGYKKYLGSAFCYAVIAFPFIVGVDVPAIYHKNEDEEEKNTENVAEGDKPMTKEEIREFVEVLFKGAGSALQIAARDSPVAISRFVELCLEMDELGVFSQ